MKFILIVAIGLLTGISGAMAKGVELVKRPVLVKYEDLVKEDGAYYKHKYNMSFTSEETVLQKGKVSLGYGMPLDQAAYDESRDLSCAGRVSVEVPSGNVRVKIRVNMRGRDVPEIDLPDYLEFCAKQIFSEPKTTYFFVETVLPSQENDVIGWD